jgi:hypothetical protein
LYRIQRCIQRIKVTISEDSKRAFLLFEASLYLLQFSLLFGQISTAARKLGLLWAIKAVIFVN